MSLSIMLFLIAVAILLYLDIMLICMLIINKLNSDGNSILSSKRKGFLIDALLGLSMDSMQTTKRDEETKQNGKKDVDASSYFDMKQSIQLDKLKKIYIESHIEINKLEKRQIRRLRSLFETSRVEAAVYLGLIGTDRAREELEKSITKEKSYPVKLYMANALSDIAKPESIPALVASLENSHRWYRDRVNMLIADFGKDFDAYLPQVINSNRIEIMELIVDFS